MTWPNQFTDPTGRYVIGAIRDSSGTGAAVQDMREGGRQVGVYIDDQTPDLRGWLAEAVASWPRGLVMVGIPDGRPHLRYSSYGPNVVNLQEWYPFGGPWSWRVWGPPPKCEGYIIQWRLPGLDGEGNPTGRPPTAWQRRRLMMWMHLRRPRYLFLY